MKNLFALVLLFASFSANAAVAPAYQDIKLPTQKMIEHQAWAAPAAQNARLMLSAQAGPADSTATSITSFLAQPDFARTLSITPAGSSSNLRSCVIAVSGLDYLGHSISENFTFAAAQTTQVSGAKAFASVSSVAFPANCIQSPFGASFSLGASTGLGVKRCMDNAGYLLHGIANAVKEVTAPTMAADASVVSANTAKFSTALDGSKNFDLLFIQNFKCVR